MSGGGGNADRRLLRLGSRRGPRDRLLTAGSGYGASFPGEGVQGRDRKVLPGLMLESGVRCR